MSTTPLSRISSTPYMDSAYPAAPQSDSKQLAGLNDGPQDLDGDKKIGDLEIWADDFKHWLFKNKNSLHELSAQQWAQIDAWIKHVQQTTGAYDWDPRVQLGIIPGSATPSGGGMGPAPTGPQGSYILNEPQNTLTIGPDTPEGTYEVWGNIDIFVNQVSYEGTFEITGIEVPSEPPIQGRKIILRDRATGKEIVIIQHEVSAEDGEAWEAHIYAANPDAIQVVGESVPPGVEVHSLDDAPRTNSSDDTTTHRQSDIPYQSYDEETNTYTYVVDYGRRARFNPQANGTEGDPEEPITETHVVYGDGTLQLDATKTVENITRDGEDIIVTVTHALDGSQDVFIFKNGSTVEIRGKEEWINAEGGTGPGDIPPELEDFVTINSEGSAGSGPTKFSGDPSDTPPDRIERAEDGDLRNAHIYETKNDVTLHADFDVEPNEYILSGGGTLVIYPEDFENIYQIEKLGEDQYLITLRNAEGKEIKFWATGFRNIELHGLEANIHGDIDGTFRLGGAPLDEGGLRVRREDLSYDTEEVLEKMREINGNNPNGRREVLRIFNLIDAAFRTGNWQPVEDVLTSLSDGKVDNGIRALVATLSHMGHFEEIMSAIPGEIRQLMMERASSKSGNMTQKFNAPNSWDSAYDGLETHEAIAMIAATLGEDDFDSSGPTLPSTDEDYGDEDPEGLEDPEDY